MICIPIKKENYQDLIAEMKEAEELADVLELWFDEVKNLDKEGLEKAFSSSKLPILYKFQGNMENLQRIVKFEPQYIDLDIETPKTTVEEVKKLSLKTQIIISYHNFNETPDEANINKKIRKIYKMGADIAKIAVMAKDFKDSMRILRIIEDLNSNDKKAICIGMGEEGKITRETGHLFGNYLMYAPLREKDRTAPGQLTAAELYKIHSLTK